MSLSDLGRAIAAYPIPVEVAYVGFDLYLKVFSSGRVKMTGFKAGGTIATGEESPDEPVVPFPTVGDGIVICFDPTLEPEAFRLGPEIAP